MTKEEFKQKVRALIPNADFAWDNDGQLVIYTNLVEDDNGNLQEMTA